MYLTSKVTTYEETLYLSSNLDEVPQICALPVKFANKSKRAHPISLQDNILILDIFLNNRISFPLHLVTRNYIFYQNRLRDYSANRGCKFNAFICIIRGQCRIISQIVIGCKFELLQFRIGKQKTEHRGQNKRKLTWQFLKLFWLKCLCTEEELCDALETLLPFLFVLFLTVCVLILFTRTQMTRGFQFPSNYE